MSQFFTDITGVLVFDGSPRVTPIVRMFFEPFCDLDSRLSGEDGEENGIKVTKKQDLDPEFWSAFEDDFKQAYLNLITASTGIQPPDDFRQVLLDIGRYFQADEEVLEAILGNCTFEDLDLVDVFKIAAAIPDGHNLKGIRLMGGSHGDKMALWGFGGFIEYADTEGAEFGLGTWRLNEIAKKIQRGEGAEASSDLVGQMLMALPKQHREEAARAVIRQAQSHLRGRYTVFGVYEETGQRFTDFVKADFPEEAERIVEDEASAPITIAAVVLGEVVPIQ